MTSDRFTDALVIGGGLVGLACADALADRGATVRLLAAAEPGQASPAAAGLLAPSLESGDSPAHRFAVAARDVYPAFVAALERRTGRRVPLDRSGILQLALAEDDEARLRAAAPRTAAWLDARALAALEPALAHARGALHHPDDGWVDNVLLLEALAHAVARRRGVEIVPEAAAAIARSGDGVEATTASGARVGARVAVLAAGAWAPRLAGLPRPIPVEPVRGQMLSLDAEPLRHAVYGPGGYLVPRADGRTLVGATMERVGFDPRTTPEGIDGLRATAETLCPPLAEAARLDAWAGLRPITPDLEPIIGPDPEWPALIYACGHSRNGILMAPLTGDVVARLALGETSPHDLAPFRVERFEGR